MIRENQYSVMFLFEEGFATTGRFITSLSILFQFTYPLVTLSLISFSLRKLFLQLRALLNILLQSICRHIPLLVPQSISYSSIYSAVLMLIDAVNQRKVSDNTILFRNYVCLISFYNWNFKYGKLTRLLFRYCLIPDIIKLKIQEKPTKTSFR